MMKKLLTIFIFFCLITTVQSQEKKKNNQQGIYNAKVSFITTKLSLTPKQAEKFWPVYNNIKKEINIIYREKKAVQNNINFSKITEKEAKEKFLFFQKSDSLINLKRIELETELSKIISYKQLLNLKKAENQFKKKLLEILKKKN